MSTESEPQKLSFADLLMPTPAEYTAMIRRYADEGDWRQVVNLLSAAQSDIPIDLMRELGDKAREQIDRERIRKADESCAADLIDEWRYFDNGGATADRYSIWQGDGWLGCSENPFDPQGVSLHDRGLPPDVLIAERKDWAAENREIEFADLPEPVQRAVTRDALDQARAEREDEEGPTTSDPDIRPGGRLSGLS